MELRHLRYFTKTAELLHFTKAAKALHTSQPNLSLQLAQLEEELGCELFDRIGRGIRLTEAGSVFLERARRILADVESARQDVDEVRGLVRGSLRIGVTHLFAAKVLSELVIDFARAYPKIHLVMTKGPTDELERAIIDSQLDAAFVILPTRLPEFDSLEILRDEVAVAVSKKHKFAKARSLKLNNLAEVPLALPLPGYSLRRWIDDGFRRANVSPQVRIETNDFESLGGIVRSGLVGTLLLRYVASSYDGVTTVRLNEDNTTRQVALIWRKGTPAGATVTRFADMALTKLRPKTTTRGL